MYEEGPSNPVNLGGAWRVQREDSELPVLEETSAAGFSKVVGISWGVRPRSSVGKHGARCEQL